MLIQIKRYLERFKPYLILRQAKWCLQASLDDFEKRNKEVITLVPDGHSKGNVLLSYMSEAFLLKPGQPIPNGHPSYWASLQMARTFVDLGYSVDVIHFLNQRFIPRKDYSVMIDTRFNLQRLMPFLDKKCLKIMHLDTAHILYHNAAEAAQLLALQQRRGVTLRPRRYEALPNLCIEHADCATTPGNDFTISTFRYANKPIYRVPIAAGVSFPWPSAKDFDTCRKRFLWFASGGFVHKGLDLVLEAFAEMPDYHLTVCGPIEQEQEFVDAYRRELYHTANIETIGWVDANSAQFRKIADRCVAHVLASCSEGAVTSVVESMHAGVIPLVTYECGVDVHDFGVLLKSTSINDIQETVRMISEMPLTELEARARKAWEFARANHTREKFAQEYRRTIEIILASHQ